MPVFGLRPAGLPVSTGFWTKPTRLSCSSGQGGSEFIYIRGLLRSLNFAGFWTSTGRFTGLNRFLDQTDSTIVFLRSRRFRIYIGLWGSVEVGFEPFFDQNFDHFFFENFFILTNRNIEMI